VSGTDPNRADAASCVDVLSILDFAGNHNGGMIEFGKDGYLYIGTGDGGGGGDPQRTAQNTTNLLGKMLRIDVDNKDPGKEYAVPGDNPFGNEVFMLGLRNPWRWSFDTATGDMWIGDVGQGVIEEVDVLLAGQQKGKNLGWSVFEGTSCCMTQGDKCTQSGTQAACNLPDMVMPKDQRTHGQGWLAIIGGQVYRGSCYPDMVGWYFYSDNNKGGLAKARLVGDAFEKMDLTGTFPNNPASIHADSRGELFITTSSSPGRIYHIEAGP
jgi:glucose/arabinose dehydrogenase